MSGSRDKFGGLTAKVEHVFARLPDPSDPTRWKPTWHEPYFIITVDGRTGQWATASKPATKPNTPAMPSTNSRWTCTTGALGALPVMVLVTHRLGWLGRSDVS